MPSDEEVTQRAGSLRSMTGLTEAEFAALLPHFEHALVAYMQDRTNRQYQDLWCIISQRQRIEDGRCRCHSTRRSPSVPGAYDH